MKDPHSANWYRGATLAERAALPRPWKPRSPLAKPKVEGGDRRLRRWRAQPPFDVGNAFDRRLAQDGMEEEELRYLLRESAETLFERFSTPPAWVEQLVRAYQSGGPGAGSDTHSRTGALSEAPGFLEPFVPLIQESLDHVLVQLRSLVEADPDLPIDSDTIADVLLPGLTRRVLAIATPTLVLELNVARLRGRLKGDTPQERFRSFGALHSDRERSLALLAEYPVMARLATQAVSAWARFSVELFGRLAADWKVVREKFFPRRNVGVLMQMVSGAGDTHRDGRSVALLHFSSGLKLVYKPRSLAIDVHFQELLERVNQWMVGPGFRTLEVLNRDSYGWVEFIEFEGCTSVEEIELYYQRQGGYLALLYALEATDLHSENLIASGAHPVLLDLEALFHPRLPAGPNGDAIADEPSVMGVGLLPSRIWGDQEKSGIDLSGLGHREGQLTPFELPAWQDVWKDTMYMPRQRLRLPGQKNRPTLRGVRVDLNDYVQDVVDGFVRVYEMLLENRDELTSPDGPLAKFHADEVRYIPRATQTYATVLEMSYHPDALRDGLDRERFLDLLWMQAEKHPFLTALIPFERRDLWRGDFPIFTSRPDSRDLWTSSGERIKDFFEEPGMARVLRRVQKLSRADMETQLSLIRASLAEHFEKTRSSP